MKVVFSNARDAAVKQAIFSEDSLKALHGRFKDRPELSNELVIQGLEYLVSSDADAVTRCLDEGILQAIITKYETYSTEGMNDYMPRHSTILLVAKSLDVATPEDLARIVNVPGFLHVFAQGLLHTRSDIQSKVSGSADKVFKAFDLPTGNAAVDFISTNMKNDIEKLKKQGQIHEGFTAFNDRFIRAQVAAGQN